MANEMSALDIFSSINLSDLLLRIEIDSETWAKKSAREKLAYLKGELKRVKLDKLVSVGSNLVSALITLVRYNTRSKVVSAYLGVIETALGLAKASMVFNNVFVSAKHRVVTEYDNLAKFMGVDGGVSLCTGEYEVTPDICKAFVNMSAAQQKKYGLRFVKMKSSEDDDVHEDDEEKESGIQPQSMLITYIDSVYHDSETGMDVRIGFEIGYATSKKNTGNIDSDVSYSYAYAAIPLSEEIFDPLEVIDSVMYAAYIDSIDVTKNIIDIRGGMLHTRPRVDIDFDVRNFDLVENGKVIRTMESEIDVIRTVLENNDRRGYIVQGDQGTGKTISVNKLLMSFPNVPVFWISANSVDDSRKMMDVFRILNMFPGSIFVFDDFDGNDLSIKNQLTTTFISCIDETTSPQFKGVLFLIINEPQRLHSTIKLRPGRIDDIIYVRNPDTVEQVADIVKQRFVHMKADLPQWVDIDNPEFHDAAELIISSSLTHAFISGIINDLVKLNHDGCTCEKFRDLIMRRNSSIRNAKMVAMDDGHIMEMNSNVVTKNRVISVTNTQGRG